MLYKGDSVDMDCDNIKGTPCGPETKYIETELLVLGGGLPGVCAAIQASEMKLNGEASTD